MKNWNRPNVLLSEMFRSIQMWLKLTLMGTAVDMEIRQELHHHVSITASFCWCNAAGLTEIIRSGHEKGDGERETSSMFGVCAPEDSAPSAGRMKTALIPVTDTLMAASKWDCLSLQPDALQECGGCTQTSPPDLLVMQLVVVGCTGG